MQKRYLGTLSFVLALSLGLRPVQRALAQALPPTNPEAQSVHGTVVNSLTHEAIGRALVFSPDKRFATLSDGEGHFEFTVPAASFTETLMARKPGFLPNSGRIANPSAEKELTISLTPEALITGRVVLPSSEDSDRIRVELYRQQVREGQAHWVSEAMVTTRSKGEFRFAELTPGTYKMLTRELLDRDPLTYDPHGQLYGYPPVYFPNAEDFPSADAIQLAAGQTYQGDISLVRRPYYAVKVGVVNAPPGGVNVSVSSQDRGPGYELGYNSQEHALVGMLPNGNYTLKVASYGPDAASGSLNIVVKGAPLEGPQLVLLPNGSLTVAVTEESTASGTVAAEGSNLGGPRFGSQAPRSYLSIGLESADDFATERAPWLRMVPGADNSSLVFKSVPPGRYWMRINSLRGFPAQVTSGGLDLQRQPLVMGAGASNVRIEVTIRDDGAEVEGVVEGMAKTPGDSGSSPAHIYLVPLPDGGGDYREARVSAEGKFHLQQVPPGLYQALAFDQPQPELEYRNAEAMRAYESKGQVVKLLAGQKEQLRVQVIATSE